MSLVESDFEECLEFFSRPLPELLDGLLASLGEVGNLDSQGQRVEKAALVLELTGTECVREVVFKQEERGRLRGPEGPSRPPSSGAGDPRGATTLG
ncbi:protein UL91 [Equid gammaherpesvirus 2]|nr:protein UL91 [Equid gammaherpesvirus 2]UTM04573.1 protein UL91 [Equid gammaherpesvirus 2]UTM04652.1 protein UL91 [Equid gammaherpesvirus 2]